MKRKLKTQEANEVLSLKREDVDMQLLRSYFAIKRSQDAPRFNTFDTLTLPKGRLFNKEELETTVGRYLWNMFAIPKEYLQKFGYQNIVFNSDGISAMETNLANMLIADIIDGKRYAQYLDDAEWMTLGIAYFITPTMDYDMTVPIPEVMERKEELFKKYEKELKAGDPNVAAAVEKELLDMAKDLMQKKGMEGYDFFASGGFKFNVNYKKSSIMGGVVENPYTKKLDVLKSNYATGISKEEFPYFANITIIGGYSRGVETQKSGYETKKINNSMQVITLDEKGTDCGTKQFLKVSITKEQRNMYLYRYILDGGKLTILTEDNLIDYVGKDVMMRSPMYCKGEEICSKCSGELYHKMGFKNAGLLSSNLSGALMNLAMKKFHDSTVKFSRIDVQKFIKER
jgi:hypothetical protein